MTIGLRHWVARDVRQLQSAVVSSPALVTQQGEASLHDLGGCGRAIETHLSAAGPARYNFAISVDGEAVGSVGISSIDGMHQTGGPTTGWRPATVARGSPLAV